MYFVSHAGVFPAFEYVVKTSSLVCFNVIGLFKQFLLSTFKSILFPAVLWYFKHLAHETFSNLLEILSMKSTMDSESKRCGKNFPHVIYCLS